jgi:alpha-beta hydrolase superfamily lysophospholipase
MNKTTLLAWAALALVPGILAGAVLWGGPKTPPALPGINHPFKSLDYSTLPPSSHFTARDGSALAYRFYAPATQPAKGSVVLLHGSSASSRSMHTLARALAAGGYSAYALDVRGHGESGTKGHIRYVGQLEDDLQDFMTTVRPPAPATLLGFSSGGGFALRFAGSARQDLFASYLLLSPFIHQSAPTARPDSGGWVSVGIPRLVALTLLNLAGIHRFNDLPVTRFALDEQARTELTAQYSYNLAQNYRPPHDYRANIRAVHQPLRLLAGTDDEVFFADQFAGVFAAEGQPVPVTLLPGINHIGLSVSPAGTQAALAAVDALQAPRPAR